MAGVGIGAAFDVEYVVYGAGDASVHCFGHCLRHFGSIDPGHEQVLPGHNVGCCC